jgi:hypothetical protein
LHHICGSRDFSSASAMNRDFHLSGPSFAACELG